MASVIQNLLEHALGDGARSAKFECLIALPNNDYFPDNEVISTLAKTSSFPGKAHELAFIKHKGRSIPTKGQTKYSQQWECTFYLSEDHALKTAFETWLEALDQKHNYNDYSVVDNNNVKGMQNTFASNGYYTFPMVIQQLNFEMDEAPIQYILYNCFPTSVSQIETSAEGVGTILEFTVAFTYSHYDSVTVKETPPNYEVLTELTKDFATDMTQMAIESLGGIARTGTDLVTDPIINTFDTGTEYTVKSAHEIKQKLI